MSVPGQDRGRDEEPGRQRERQGPPEKSGGIAPGIGHEGEKERRDAYGESVGDGGLTRQEREFPTAGIRRLPTGRGRRPFC